MVNLYQKTFDQVHMPADRTQSLRDDLASRCSHDEMEAIPMKKGKRLHRPLAALVAVCILSALSITAFAYGDQLREFYTFFTGGAIEQGVDEDGNFYASGSVDTDNPEGSPVELRDDGRLYFVADGQNLDITDQCSYTTPYVYECADSDGNRHVFIVGGDPDAIGYAEFIWDTNGQVQGGSAQLGTSGGTDDAPWLDAAKSQFNLPW